jgi:ketosteroid isomerase-like protein
MHPTEEVTQAYAAWDAAFNKGDAKSIASEYLPDAKVLPPTHAVVSGSGEIEEFFSGLFANSFKDHKLELIEAGGDGRIVFGSALWSATGKGVDGSPQTFGGFATHVFERQTNGALKLRLHTFN